MCLCVIRPYGGGRYLNGSVGVKEALQAGKLDLDVTAAQIQHKSSLIVSHPATASQPARTNCQQVSGGGRAPPELEPGQLRERSAHGVDQHARRHAHDTGQVETVSSHISARACAVVRACACACVLVVPVEARKARHVLHDRQRQHAPPKPKVLQLLPPVSRRYSEFPHVEFIVFVVVFIIIIIIINARTWPLCSSGWRRWTGA
jgi:hypothetical protein